jgi:hypothetical protein
VLVFVLNGPSIQSPGTQNVDVGDVGLQRDGTITTTTTARAYDQREASDVGWPIGSNAGPVEEPPT